MSHQRWHEWINMSGTTCPPFGVVRLDLVSNDPTDQEIGFRVVLHGYEPDYTIASDAGFYGNTFRGFSYFHAFNGAIEVQPGQRGLLTFDLPTWCAMDPAAEDFGSLVAIFNDWKARVVTEAEIYPNTGCLRLLAADSALGIAFIGAAVTYAVEEDPAE